MVIDTESWFSWQTQKLFHCYTILARILTKKCKIHTEWIDGQERICFFASSVVFLLHKKSLNFSNNYERKRNDVQWTNTTSEWITANEAANATATTISYTNTRIHSRCVSIADVYSKETTATFMLRWRIIHTNVSVVYLCIVPPSLPPLFLFSSGTRMSVNVFVSRTHKHHTENEQQWRRQQQRQQQQKKDKRIHTQSQWSLPLVL